MPQKAYFHARVVISVLEEAISEGEIRHIRAQLPGEYDVLFEQREFLEEAEANRAPERGRS